MFVEAGILGGDEGLADKFRQLADLDDFPVFQEEFIDEFIVVVIDPGGNARAIVFERRHGGQLLQQHIIEKAAGRNGQEDAGRKQNKQDGPQAGLAGGSCESDPVRESLHRRHAATSSASSFFFLSANLAT